MKLEKDRLVAKVDNLEMSLRQNEEEALTPEETKEKASQFNTVKS